VTPDYAVLRDGEISRLADMVEAHLDMKTIADLIGIALSPTHKSTGRA